jgi:ParB family chromosome partitioning protein
MPRKRLTPTPAFAPSFEPAETPSPVPPGLETKAFGLARTSSRPPIARVAGESAAEAAAQRLAAEIEAARAEGRLVADLALEAVDPGHLVRDRLPPAPDDPDLAALKASLAEVGQRTPVEVVDLGPGVTPRYGLISGWRRMTALAALRAEADGTRFRTVRAVMRPRGAAAEAYRAMVDENENRVGLSYYERARIAAETAALGLFADPREAIRALFPGASRAKRSKIGSFLAVHAALGGTLRFPAALPERLGLRLARALEADPALGPRIAAALADAAPADAAAEAGLLERALRPPRAPAPTGWRVTRRAGRLVVEGPRVDAALAADLEAWLAARE